MFDLKNYANDFTRFCGDMVVQVGGKFRRFRDVWDDEQQKLIGKLSPSAYAVIRGDVPPTKRFYVSATKGYGKDMIATLFLTFVLMFAQRPTKSQLLANKQAQANEPLDIMRGILWADGPLNRMAASVIELQNYRVVSHQGTSRPESIIEVLTCDRQAHGSRPDILVANELSHIEDELHFRTADDNLAKCPHGLGLILSNAGFVGSWQHAVHEQMLADPLFDCTVIKHPAPWIDAKVLAHKERTDPPSRFRQYYWGEWMPPTGDVLPTSLINRAVVYECELSQYDRGGYTFFAAADLSTTTNRSGLTVHGVAPDRPIRLAAAKSWKPAEYVERSEFIRQLKDDIASLCRQFDVRLLAFDQHQSALLTDLCQQIGVPTFHYYAGSKNFDDFKNNQTMRAEILFRAFQEGWVHLYRNEQLLLDLKSTSIVTKAGGSKLEFAHEADGSHGDLADSFSTGLLIAWNEWTAQRFNLANYGSVDGPAGEVLIA